MKNLIEKTKMEIYNGIKKTISNCEPQIDIPKDVKFGDFTTNIALVLAKEKKVVPRVLAEKIANDFDKTETAVEKVEIAGAGFINFCMKSDWLYPVVPLVEELGESYGRNDSGKGKSVIVEFVSANPTGPMHMGNARGGALGEGVATVLEMSGYKVHREFFLNDAGNQIEKFAMSLESRYKQQFGDHPDPVDGYMGQDIIDLVREFIQERGEGSIEELTDYGLNKNIVAMKKVLENYNIRYDNWFCESELHENGEIERTLSDLKKAGAAYEQDGALWLKCEGKDEVLVRANGVPTYFAADIAYHRNKLETRAFDWAIDVWGADHHGHVARMQHALELLGIDPERFNVVLMQLVRLVSDGEVVRQSKRTGGAVSLDELIEDIGAEAARYFFNMRAAGSHFDFDLDLAVRQSNDNPVYYVQYAHARICSILEQIKDDFVGADVNLLKSKEEIALLRSIAHFPEEVAMAATTLEPSRLAFYAKEVAGAFHTFYNSCRVISDNKDLMIARARLINSARVVLNNTLTALGVSAPKKM